MPLPTGTRLGPYAISPFSGAGGMGEKYKARDTRLDRSVPIKVLPPEAPMPRPSPTGGDRSDPHLSMRKGTAGNRRRLVGRHAFAGTGSRRLA